MKLLILSDLFGNRNTNWVDSYIDFFKHNFQVQYYECCELAGIDIEKTDKDEIHQQFIGGGIEKAVKKYCIKKKRKLKLLGLVLVV
ncbi:MAG: hypothetical protein IT215_07985 [Chitinophagaceae bacterium]|nr:hypothetical protein [Chitinophagaceae bacterium]